jgi:hypothetical protein
MMPDTITANLDQKALKKAYAAYDKAFPDVSDVTYDGLKAGIRAYLSVTRVSGLPEVEPVAWLARAKPHTGMGVNANTSKSILVEWADRIYGKNEYDLLPLYTALHVSGLPKALDFEACQAIVHALAAALAGAGFDGGDFDGLNPDAFNRALKWALAITLSEPEAR